ncbi:MAG: mechanosensitive ion channel family protein [Rhodospirillaceae bacterium]|jgi:small conductance mechanosensitive channel|nr:mechanosensitive ion channel family protein [Rhodospirillaceae bacterium]MBT5810562.1 mechanosensitive ion channel family protein [Rhodospirillaceae bacterium]
MPQDMQTLQGLLDTVLEFAVAYGFQIAGAVFILLIGLKVAVWVGAKAQSLCEAKNLDVTLSGFIGNVVRLVVIAFVIIITLGNFGITIAPLIALAGAAAFGATFAIQGPLANYGAGLSIIMTRPFIVGNTITVRGASGVVETISLAATVLRGEDGERITVPNKQVVGEIIINSDTNRIVETNLCIGLDADPDDAINVIRQAVTGSLGDTDAPPPQAGIHDFSYGGVVIGIRYWAPSQKYFETRYAVNAAVYRALAKANIKLIPLAHPAIITDAIPDAAPPPSTD